MKGNNPHGEKKDNYKNLRHTLNRLIRIERLLDKHGIDDCRALRGVLRASQQALPLGEIKKLRRDAENYRKLKSEFRITSLVKSHNKLGEIQRKLKDEKPYYYARLYRKLDEKYGIAGLISAYKRLVKSHKKLTEIREQLKEEKPYYYARLFRKLNERYGITKLIDAYRRLHKPGKMSPAETALRNYRARRYLMLDEHYGIHNLVAAHKALQKVDIKSLSQKALRYEKLKSGMDEFHPRKVRSVFQILEHFKIRGSLHLEKILTDMIEYQEHRARFKEFLKTEVYRKVYPENYGSVKEVFEFIRANAPVFNKDLKGAGLLRREDIDTLFKKGLISARNVAGEVMYSTKSSMARFEDRMVETVREDESRPEQPLGKRVLETIRENPGVTRKEIEKHLHGTALRYTDRRYAQLSNCLINLGGAIRREKAGRGGKYYLSDGASQPKYERDASKEARPYDEQELLDFIKNLAENGRCFTLEDLEGNLPQADCNWVWLALLEDVKFKKNIADALNINLDFVIEEKDGITAIRIVKQNTLRKVE